MNTSKLALLESLGANPEELSKYEILCLPDNISSGDEELYESDELLSVYKELKANGVKSALADDLAIKSGQLERRSGDLWLGLYWILQNVALPIFIAVILKKIEPYLNKNAEHSLMPRQSQPKVHLDMSIKKGDDFNSIKYKGDADTLKSILAGLETGNSDGRNDSSK